MSTEQDVHHRNRLIGQVSARWEYSRIYEGWRRRAACAGADPEIFFARPDGERKPSARTELMTQRAKALCEACPVVYECLGYAVQLDLRYGVWGGLSEAERATLTERRSG